MLHSESNENLWIWYPGDFEIRHSLLQNLQREERGFDWPAYWSIDDCNKNVLFYNTFHLEKEETFSVHADGNGYVEIEGKKHPFGKNIACPKGNITIKVYVSNAQGLPCAFITGKSIFSNECWTASNFCNLLPVGTNAMFYEQEQSPNQISYLTEERFPVDISYTNNGTLYDFLRVANGVLNVEFLNDNVSNITLCYGESETEALDIERCYYKQEQVTRDSVVRKRAFRYVYIPGHHAGDFLITVSHEFLPKSFQADFCCDDVQLNDIWNISEETFRLCSDLFFIDGVKRDRWIWSGDAYQSYLINQYMFFDAQLNERTILALRGHDHIKQHINTIVDYSMLWVISNEIHFLMSGNIKFLKLIYPKMKSMMDYLTAQTDELGFIHGREGDWIFIDWAEMDKTGAISAEQMLLLKSYDAMISLGEYIGERCVDLRSRRDVLSENIDTYFWDNELGAYIDSYESGKRKITRHSNIFAVIFNLTSDEKKEKILRNVLLNESIPQIVTPYFKFFESDALCLLGRTDVVMNNVRSYWGGMIELGATTFWEEFNPSRSGAEHYEMYGDPYGKSLCHAWGASPIYLIGRYILGVYPVRAGYEEFHVEPNLTGFTSLSADIPVKDGVVSFRLEENKLEICSTRSGGKVIFGGQTVFLIKNQPAIFKLEASDLTTSKM